MKYGSKEFCQYLYALADKIGVSHELVMKYSGLADSANKEFFVVVKDDGACEWYYSERGSDNLLATAKSVEDLLYEIFQSITSTVSFAYEAKNRIENQDSRLIAFNHQLSLMKKLNESWYNRLNSRLKGLIHAIERQDARRRERSGNR